MITRHSWMLVTAMWGAACYALVLDQQGPSFTSEPPFRVEFSNDSGARLECGAHGSPTPRVTWLLADGSAASNLSGVRVVTDSGAVLLFPPFPAEKYRQDAHTTIYRCRADNAVGAIISRDVHVRAVVKQKYDVDVYDEHVISENTAVLRCHVPSYVTEYVMVTSWVQDNTVNIYPNTYTGVKYAVLPNGDLFIYSASPSDGYKSYSCRTLHRLTKEIHVSSSRGRVIIQEPKGTEPPRLSVEKRISRHVKVGDDVMLPCAAQAYPLPTYTWMKEEEQQQLVGLSSNERFYQLHGVLRISKVRLQDAGKYVCWVNNSVGKETVEVRLVVTSALSAHVQPPSQVVDVGQAAVFRCLPSGHPVSKIIWLRNGRPLTADRRYQVYPPDTLKIPAVEKEDSGMFQCLVSNEWDMAQAAGELQLGDASPELVYRFSEQTLQPGPSVSLKCTAVGNPPPQFVWTLDGFPLPDSDRFLVGQYVTIHDSVISHVNISNIREEDGGEYTCSAKNTVGRVAHSARVNVYGLPFIRVMPKVKAVAGRDLVIKCPVAGFPIEAVTWERGSASLPTNRRQRVYPNGTLLIEHVQRMADADTYTCQARNRQGYSARRDVEVVVLVPPKIMPFQFMNNLLREGMRAAISCQVLEGDPPLSFAWAKNGQPLPHREGISVRAMDDYSHMLVIERINSTHNGDYTCIAENVVGRETYTAQLTVNVPPKWTVEPKDSSGTFGEDIILNCQADGYPTPTVTWRKATGNQPGDYKEFTYDPHVEFYNNGSLLFREVTKDSEGHYLCEARNGVGTGVSKVIFLKVNAPAHFPHKTKQLQVRKGERSHLQCTALGDTPMDITWHTAGLRIEEQMDRRYSVREQLLDDGMVSELSVFPTDRHDTATFSCSAVNAYGRDEMTIQLIVQGLIEPYYGSVQSVEYVSILSKCSALL